MINNIVNIFIKNNIINKDDADIYRYGLFVILYNGFLIIDILLLGTIFNQLKFTCLFIIFWTPYRIFIGGSHCSTPIKCCIVFNIFFLVGILLYIMKLNNFIFVINIFFLLIQLIFSKPTKVFYILWILLAAPHRSTPAPPAPSRRC